MHAVCVEYVFSSRHRVLHLIIGGRIRYGSKEVALLQQGEDKRKDNRDDRDKLVVGFF